MAPRQYTGRSLLALLNVNNCIEPELSVQQLLQQLGGKKFKLLKYSASKKSIEITFFLNFKHWLYTVVMHIMINNNNS